MKDKENDINEFLDIFNKDEQKKLKEAYNEAVSNGKETFPYKGRIFTIKEGDILIKFVEKW